MGNLPPVISEDDQYWYVPEELFEHLPEKDREAAEMRRAQANDVLQAADEDIKNFIRLANAFQTTVSLSYMYQRLRAVEFGKTADWFMENETLTTAFVVTYARLFASGSGGGGISKGQMPAHLRGVHDDIIDIRNKRYAHNDGHKSIETGARIFVDEDERYQIELQLNVGFYMGGRNEWADLVTFLHAHLYGRIQKILKRLKEKTGREWVFPTGPEPDHAETQS